MPYKKGSPEAYAQAAKMKAAREAKKKVQEDVIDEKKDGVSESEYRDLLRRFQELEGLIKQGGLPQGSQGPQVNARGMLSGTHEKYIVDPDYYPDPTNRLAHEPKLARFAFPINFRLKWRVEIIQYETIDHLRMKEPRFILELSRVVLGEDGEPTTKGYVLKRFLFHEDPQAAIVIARDHGITFDESNEKAFLDEMRHLRCRDWLFEAMDYFNGKRPIADGNRTFKEEVFENSLREVTFFEGSSTESQEIPFNEMKSKFRA